MIKKVYISFLIGLGVFSAPSNNVDFKIISNSNSKEDIEIMYEYKNEIIENYAKMIVGIDKQEVINDLILMYPNMTYENNELCLTIGNGLGKSIQGKLKNNYCDVEVKPKSWIVELFD